MFVPIYYIYTYTFVYLSTCMCIYIYMNVWKYECMNVCMYVQNERVCHTISGLHLLEAQKTCGGGIFHVARWNISQKFLALPPPTIPGRVKGGGCATLGTHIGHKSWQVHIHGNLCVDAYRGMCTCFAGLQCYHLKSYHAWQSNETIYFRQIS